MKKDPINFLDPKWDSAFSGESTTPIDDQTQTPVTPDNEQGWTSALGTAVTRGAIGVGEMTFNALAGADELFDRYVNAEPENDPDNWDLKEWSTGLAKQVESYKNTFNPARKVRRVQLQVQLRVLSHHSGRKFLLLLLVISLRRYSRVQLVVPGW